MKITGQSVPLQFRDAYKALVSTVTVGPHLGTSIRTRTAARKPQSPRVASRQTEGVAAVIKALARAFRKDSNSADHRAWRYDRAAELQRGLINQDYWHPAELVSTSILESLPTSVARAGPRKYSYPNPSNTPSIPTYPDGEASSGAPAYAGATSAGMYRDTLWRWRKSVWRLRPGSTPGDAKSIFLWIAGSMAATVSNRCSKPMFSLMVRMRQSDQDGAPTTDPSPPLHPARSYYWRYKRPRGTAPFTHYETERQIVATPAMAAEAPGGNTITTDLGPRPMLGRGYNNNTTVETTWTGSETLYESSPCSALKTAPIVRDDSTGEYGTVNIITSAYTPFEPQALTPQHAYGNLIISDITLDAGHLAWTTYRHPFGAVKNVAVDRPDGEWSYLDAAATRFGWYVSGYYGDNAHYAVALWSYDAILIMPTTLIAWPYPTWPLMPGAQYGNIGDSLSPSASWQHSHQHFPTPDLEAFQIGPFQTRGGQWWIGGKDGGSIIYFQDGIASTRVAYTTVNIIRWAAPASPDAIYVGWANEPNTDWIVTRITSTGVWEPIVGWPIQYRPINQISLCAA